MAKICYTIGEVAEILGESTSLVRFWANTYPDAIKPSRNKKGNRLFSPDDVETFKKLHLYIKDRGMTLEGAGKMIKSNAEGDARADIALKLKNIRDMLQQVHDEI
ncbi:MAG: MerR family transcriptional regulator [Bacteroidales bacterium]|nr:MerR family transcriptional regulator [Bacteroidales bacterium]